MANRSFALAVLVHVAAGTFWSPGACADSRVPRHSAIQDTDPQLPNHIIQRHLPDDWKQTWLKALESEEQDLRREATLAFLREHQLNNTSVSDVGPHLAIALDSTEHPQVQLVIATALIEFGHEPAAEQLFRLVQTGDEASSLMIEPALARWNYQPVRDIWLERLKNARSTPRRRLILAIDGVREVRELRAIDSLRRIVTDPLATPEFRLSAAEALGLLQNEGLTEEARQLSADVSKTGVSGRLLAVQLLVNHSDSGAREVLLNLAADADATVVRQAVRRLLELDPGLVRPIVPDLLRSSDGPVRKMAAQSLLNGTVDKDFVVLQGLLSDRHPDVRSYVREKLLRHAERIEFSGVIRKLAMDVLAGDDWRGQEQSALLLAELDHSEASTLLLQRLKSDRPEVLVAAAWGLRELSVPETLSPMLKFVEQLLASYQGEIISEAHDVCLSHLFEAFGQMKYSESESMLKTFVPRRNDAGARSRGAAIWALGLLHVDDPDPTVLALLVDRVRDDSILPRPEPVEVRANAAIGIGRMKAEEAVQTLQNMLTTSIPGSRVWEAIRWALEEITGEEFPDPEPTFTTPQTAFLQPIPQ